MKDDRRKTNDNIRRTKMIGSVRDLDVYRLAFDTAMEIFVITKSFPTEVQSSIINKLSDAEQEAAETQTWLEFAWKCNYIHKETFEKLDNKYEHVFAMLITMERKADAFCKETRPSS